MFGGFTHFRAVRHEVDADDEFIETIVYRDNDLRQILSAEVAVNSLKNEDIVRMLR